MCQHYSTHESHSNKTWDHGGLKFDEKSLDNYSAIGGLTMVANHFPTKSNNIFSIPCSIWPP